MPQRSIRFSEALHDAVEAEAARRGYPHTFSSVLQEAAERGLGVSGGPAGPEATNPSTGPRRPVRTPQTGSVKKAQAKGAGTELPKVAPKPKEWGL